MASSITIDSGPVSADDLLRRVPKDKWHDLMLARRQFMEINLTYDCRCLVQFVEDAKVMYEVLGFDDPEDMIRKGYNLVPEEIDIAIEWLRLNPTDGPVPFEATLREKAGRPPNNDRQSTIIGRANVYRLARLKRDHPEIRAAYDRGEFKSVRAAAIAAGIIKNKSTLEQLLHWWSKATEPERETFKQEIASLQKGAEPKGISEPGISRQPCE